MLMGVGSGRGLERMILWNRRGTELDEQSWIDPIGTVDVLGLPGRWWAYDLR
jgi:hypothetical protein